MTTATQRDCIITSDGVIIEGMGQFTDFRAWMYPPSRDNWWAWGSVFFVLLFAFMLSAAYLMPIRSDVVAVPQVAPTPAKTSIGPHLKPTERVREGF
jgi:hypothetical protein